MDDQEAGCGEYAVRIIRAAPNPGFAPNRPLSYESILCRLAGWWTTSESTLTPEEVTLNLLLPIKSSVPQSEIIR